MPTSTLPDNAIPPQVHSSDAPTVADSVEPAAVDITDAESERDRNAEALARMWATYKASGDKAIREHLIIHYSPLVKYVAGRVGAPSRNRQVGRSARNFGPIPPRQ